MPTSIFCQSSGKHNVSTVDLKNRKIIKNKKTYDIPKHIRCNNVTQIDGEIFIDGYEFTNGQFKRTLKALWHLFF